MSNIETKELLRREVMGRVKDISPGERAELSQAAVERLEGQAEWQAAKTVLVFAPLADELDIWAAVERAIAGGEKEVYLPRYDRERDAYHICRITSATESLREGKFGIREPHPNAPACTEMKRLDFALAPGVAFDPQGRRLGRGRGFYDRLLKTLNARICGVTYDAQVVERVPVETHDISANFILTPTRWIVV